MIRFTDENLEQIVEKTEKIISEVSALEFHLLNTFNLGLSEKDSTYRKLLESRSDSNINLPDGWPVALWLSILHRKRIKQIRGSDLLRYLVLNGKQNSHFFVGSTSETLTALKHNLEHLNKNAIFAGFFSPPFAENPDSWLPEFIDSLREIKVDYLWVGLGTPKQDYIVRTIAESKLEIKAIFAVGAAFDFIAGVKKEVPAFMRRAGLEWLHRLFSEPKRLWKRYTIFQLYFIKSVLRSSFK